MTKRGALTGAAVIIGLPIAPVSAAFLLGVYIFRAVTSPGKPVPLSSGSLSRVCALSSRPLPHQGGYSASLAGVHVVFLHPFHLSLSLNIKFLIKSI